MDGRCVQLVGGDPARRIFDEDDAVARAVAWQAEGADGLHVVDLDAALGRGDNATLVARILDAVDVPVQVGGGLRDDEAIRRTLEEGAQHVVVGTRALEDPEWLRRAATAWPDRLVVAVDVRGGRVVIRGWTEATSSGVVEAARALEALPLAGLLCTGVDAEGRGMGVDHDLFKRLLRATRLPVIASGGVSSMDDIRFLAAAGAEACVIGTALYAGRLRLEDARAAARGSTAR
jgi:phosphoribosylformimino-5-aminoimidazole carboxamide ribotide isomerase